MPGITSSVGKIFLYGLLFVVTGCLTKGEIVAATTGGFPNDTLSPTVNIIAPQDGAEVAGGRPLIQIDFYDAGSGVDQSTVRVGMDQNDITTQAITQSNLAQQGIAMESAVNPYTISYQPLLPLTRGTHLLYFAVRDKAGNLTEVRRSFMVQAFNQDTWAGITNTFNLDWQPDKKMTDTIEWGFQSPVAGTDLRFDATTKVANYPNGRTPFYRAEGYNAYLDRYILNWKKNGLDLSWGYTVVPVESELFQIGREIRGAVAMDIVDTLHGTNHLALFSGQVATTYGIGIAVYDFSGMSELWEGKSGWKMSGLYASIGGDTGWDLIDLNGRSQITKTAVLQWEIIHYLSKISQKTGDGLISHYDTVLGGVQFGLDFLDLQPEYTLPGAPAQYSPTRGGIRSWGIRLMTPLYKGFFSVNGIYTYDNLAGSLPDTRQRLNLNGDYQWFPLPDLNLDVSYQGEWRIVSSFSGEEYPSSDPVAHNFQLNLTRQGRTSSAKLSFSQARYLNYYGSDSKDDAHLFASWTKRAGIFNLTPAVEWKKGCRPDESGVFEERFSVEGRFFPDLSNSKLTIYHQSFSGGKTEKSIDGLGLHLYFQLWKKASLLLHFQNEWWTNHAVSPSTGLDAAYNLEWICKF